jgi:hypothetical protein
MSTLQHIGSYEFVVWISPVLIGCGGGSSGNNSNTATVYGTITLPQGVTVTNKCALVALDNDNNIYNTATTPYLITTVSGTSFTYTLASVPTGTYYLYAAVNQASTTCDENVGFIYDGVIFGRYNGTGTITVNNGDNGPYDFTLSYLVM